MFIINYYAATAAEDVETHCHLELSHINVAPVPAKVRVTEPTFIEASSISTSPTASDTMCLICPETTPSAIVTVTAEPPV
jgi:hypothetical protein